MALVIAGAAVFGLLIGSFINVVAYRVPEGRSVVTPPSACPSCDDPIQPRDNIPVVSWLLLRGRCRSCSAQISARYPIVEASTGAAFGVTAGLVGLEWVLPAYLWFVGVTIALTLTDLDHKRIPNAILYPSTVVAVVLLGGGAALDGRLGDFGRALAGGAAYFFLFFLLALAARGGFGFGDVKLGFFLGLYLAFEAWGVLVTGIFLSFLLGGVVAIALLAARRRGRKDAVAFGPSMVGGAYIALIWGREIVDWYLGTGT